MKYQSVKSNLGDIFSGPLLCKPEINKDKRGYFYESWNQKDFKKASQKENFFVQDNESFSLLGVIRGLHYQINPEAQGKLLKVAKGGIYDVIVDLRSNSSTFMQWCGINLNETNKLQLWIPEGFAHGFLTLTKNAIVSYKVTSYWSKEHEKTVIWNDKDLNINWPIEEIKISKPIISYKDSLGLKIKDIVKSGDIF